MAGLLSAITGREQVQQSSSPKLLDHLVTACEPPLTSSRVRAYWSANPAPAMKPITMIQMMFDTTIALGAARLEPQYAREAGAKIELGHGR